jgi:hypothetical protein
MSQIFSELIIVGLLPDENHIFLCMIQMKLDIRHMYLTKAMRYLPVLK